MKHILLVLAALPALAACGDAAEESDDPVAGETALMPAEPATPAGTPTPALPDAGLVDPAETSATPPPVVGTQSPAERATVPPTDQDARYQDSVTEQPEAAR